MTVAVVGAGVVGMACARALQRAGQQVVVVDPEPPGAGCSHGNAGVIAVDHVLPLARPEVLRGLPAMLGAPDSPLYLKLSRLPGLAPWLLRMAWASRPTTVERGSIALANLVRGAVGAWREELESCNARELLVCAGSYLAYETPRAYAKGKAQRAVMRQRGVATHDLHGHEVAARLPALAPVHRALYYPDTAHVLNPRRLVETLANAFCAAGGTLETRHVQRLLMNETGVTLEARDWRLDASQAVIAAGWRSAELCAPLGCSVPLGVEMGYHVGFDPLDGLAAPVAIAGRGFMATPLDGELRVAGTVEFARSEAAPDWRRAELLERQARRLFGPVLSPLRNRWRGSRPTLPDFLPAIGPLRPGSLVYAAFGHQHIGLTTAAVTGQLICDVMLGREPTFDPAPFSPDRFRQ
jgi:D-amino-acid dehydrogenase